MYSTKLNGLIRKQIQTLKKAGAYKIERVLESPQSALVKVNHRSLLMFASNNYLGLANDARIKKAARKSLARYGFGMSSVRFICGTNTLHKKLEAKLSKFLGTGDAILFSSCFAANEAFFASLINQTGLAEEQAVIYSDELNHASIIDGLKLVKSRLFVKRIFPHNDLKALEKMLAEDKKKNYPVKIIASDGVFSMEGELANLPGLVKLAERFKTLLFIDDSHGVGACGRTGKGSPEALKVSGRIDVLSGTLGKALGGAAGGYLAGNRELIEFFRQKARPYTFSNSLPPMIIAAALEALEILQKNSALVKKLNRNTEYFRKKVTAAGFKVIKGFHPIVPIMIGETALTQKFAAELFKEGLLLPGLWFPVVPEGTARLRAQISAVHSRQQLDEAVAILTKVGKKFKLINKL